MPVLDSLPLLVLNLGGEMMYILNQQFSTQGMNEATSTKVRQDLLKALLSPTFIDELMKPQSLYDLESLKKLFHKLAHSSVFRLNQESMDKLFDLMLMAVKYQLLACARNFDVILMTFNHIDGMREMNHNQDTDDHLLERTFDLILKKYSDYSHWRLQSIRQNILNLLQDWRVRVAVFLQEGIQYSDGYFNLQYGGDVPYGFRVPGTSPYDPPGFTPFKTPIEFLPPDNSVYWLEFVNNRGRGTSVGCNLFEKKSNPSTEEETTISDKPQAITNAEWQWQLLSKFLETECRSCNEIKLDLSPPAEKPEKSWRSFLLCAS